MRERGHQRHPRDVKRDHVRKGSAAEAALARVAAEQYGVAPRAQLLERGVSRMQIENRVASGFLIPLHRGVYAVGHSSLRPAGRRLAAVLACGPGAVLWPRDAGAAWDLCADAGSRIHVAVPRGGARGGARPGIHVHRRRLDPDETTVHEGIPIATVAVTLVGLGAVLGERALGEAVDRAIELRIYDQSRVEAALRRGRPGSAALRRVLRRRHPDAHWTRSRLERAMLELIDRHALPRPGVNVDLAGLRVVPDLLWADRRLVVELDSWGFHSSPEAFEADRRKTADLQRAGYRVLRFTWRQVHHDPAWVLAHLEAALGDR